MRTFPLLAIAIATAAAGFLASAAVAAPGIPDKPAVKPKIDGRPICDSALASTGCTAFRPAGDRTPMTPSELSAPIAESAGTSTPTVPRIPAPASQPATDLAAEAVGPEWTSDAEPAFPDLLFDLVADDESPTPALPIEQLVIGLPDTFGFDGAEATPIAGVDVPKADAVAVPEPSTLVLLALGLLGLGSVGRRRTR